MRSVLQGSTIIRQESQEIAAVKTVLMVMLLIVRGLRPALSVNRLVIVYSQQGSCSDSGPESVS